MIQLEHPWEGTLCIKHGRPIQPAMWRHGSRTTGCARCKNTEPGYLKRKHKYETSDRGRMMDIRHKASKSIDKVRRGLRRPTDPFALFTRLTGWR